MNYFLLGVTKHTAYFFQEKQAILNNIVQTTNVVAEPKYTVSWYISRLMLWVESARTDFRRSHHSVQTNVSIVPLSTIRAVLRSGPAGQLPGAKTYMGRENITGINMKYVAS
jgi:hypothetical protein